MLESIRTLAKNLILHDPLLRKYFLVILLFFIMLFILCFEYLQSNLWSFKMFKGLADENEAQINVIRKLVKVRITTS